MRLMLINTDRTIFTPESAAQQRLTSLRGGAVESVDSVTFSLAGHKLGAASELAPEVRAHPTNSFLRLFYGWDALAIAKTLPRPDVVSAQDPFETGLAAFFIARHFNVPLVVEMHTDFLSPSYARHSLLNRFRLTIASFVIPRAAASYAVSEHVKESVTKKYHLAEPPAVLPIYVDLKKSNSILRNPQKGNVVWIGRFEREKNPALAIRALAFVRQKGFDARLTMLGTGRLEERLKRLAGRLGLWESVEFPGWTDPAPYLARAELMLVTSKYEGYGMALVEALAAGVPVLSTDVGVAREAGATVVQEPYTEALCAWLSGAREAGVLKLRSYSSEQEYVAQLRAFYAAAAKKS